MESVIQSLLARTEYRNINAWREFTLLLLPLLSRKLRKTVPALIPHPPVLAHTIYQALAFDSSLREEGFDLPGTSAAVGKDKGELTRWQGISEVILGRKDWFEAWMEGERACRCRSPTSSTDTDQLLAGSRNGSIHGNHQLSGCLAYRGRLG